jgi:enoyl-CoA hydratase/carnithine racemase
MSGGTEFVVSYDLVIAANTAYFGLSEVKRGLTPIRGALPRPIRTIGLQRSSGLALTGRNITAQEAFTWGLVNKAVPQAEVVNEAVRYAAMIAANSPDAVMYMGWFEARIEDRGSRAGSGDHVGTGVCRIAEK